MGYCIRSHAIVKNNMWVKRDVLWTLCSKSTAKKLNITGVEENCLNLNHLVDDEILAQEDN